MSVKVSVVIPTRERPDTLQHALRTIVNQSHSNLEIIVSDNASGPETRSVVMAFEDPRIRYINTGQRVSMSENFEFALSHATGDWLCVIGDDDGMLPTGLERGLAALAGTGLEALGSMSAHYRWPSPDGSGPEMYLTVPTGRGFQVCNAKDHIQRLLNARLSYTSSPMLYTGGIISRQLYERIKAVRGRFFYSMNPDLFSAFAVCSFVDQFLMSHEPLMVIGHSRHSTGLNIQAEAGAAFVSENTVPIHVDMALLPDESRHASLPMHIYESFLQSDYLRQKPVAVSPQHQLQLFDKVARKLGKDHHRGEFHANWSRRFAQHHGLTLNAAHVQPTPIHDHIKTFKQRAHNLLRHYRIDRTISNDYANVYDAASTSERIFKSRPSFLINVLQSVRRRLIR